MQRRFQSRIRHTSYIDLFLMAGVKVSRTVNVGQNTWILLPREDLPPRIYTNLPEYKTNRDSH